MFLMQYCRVIVMLFSVPFVFFLLAGGFNDADQI